ncbi:MAG: methionine synthase [Candidatus Micrarchaeia archaeon]
MRLLPTTVIGSYPRPKWLWEAIRKSQRGRLSKKSLHALYDKACLETIREHEQAGVDILTDGEMRRTEMTEHFAERIGGFRFYGNVRVWGNNFYRKPSIVKKLRYRGPMLLEEFEFIKTHTDRAIKVPITGPYTIVDWSFNEYYRHKADAVMELASIERKELQTLVKAGARFIQIDEPALSTHPEEIDIAIEAINKMVKGIECKFGIHICYGDYSKIYPAMLDFKVDQFALEFANRKFDIGFLKEHAFTKELGFGCIDVHNKRVETKEEVIAGIRKGLEMLPPEKIYINPDCGLKLLPRDVAYQKLVVMCEAARELRREFS